MGQNQIPVSRDITLVLVLSQRQYSLHKVLLKPLFLVYSKAENHVLFEAKYHVRTIWQGLTAT